VGCSGAEAIQSLELVRRRTGSVAVDEILGHPLSDDLADVAALNQRRPLGDIVASVRIRRYLTDMRTTVSSRGQIVLPAEIRRKDRIRAGQEFEVERLERGKYRLVLRDQRNEGLVDWLLACPVKGFFVAVESESTDTI
jgi:AbrB family looped-hinge helix DNA binding protein